MSIKALAGVVGVPEAALRLLLSILLCKLLLHIYFTTIMFERKGLRGHYEDLPHDHLHVVTFYLR